MNRTALKLIFQYLSLDDLQEVRNVSRMWNIISKRVLLDKFTANPWRAVKQIYSMVWDRIFMATNEFIEDNTFDPINCSGWVLCENCRLPICISDNRCMSNGGYPYIIHTCAGNTILCKKCGERWTCKNCKLRKVRPDIARFRCDHKLGPGVMPIYTEPGMPEPIGDPPYGHTCEVCLPIFKDVFNYYNLFCYK